MEHPIIRHRHETRRRRLKVRSKVQITPSMIRIWLEGEDLVDFVSMSPDDHVKLFIPADAGKVEQRDYTPRLFDRAAGTLVIDFAVHDAGSATRWAVEARQGDTLEIGGPRGSAILSSNVAWLLLIGDETALPAIGRRIEETPSTVRVTSVVTITGASEQQPFETAANHEALWVHRPLERADDPLPLLSALQTISLPDGKGFVWIAAEAGVARAVRNYIVNDRRHPLAWTKAAGYWLKGVADAHEKLED